jgi:glycosyltransferase involved in cell wall biosynthesis
MRNHDVAARTLVSVIIPTHNRAALLARALNSVFSQWGLGQQFDLEVIVIDDCSTDSTASVVGEYAQVRLLRLPTHRGPSAARNAGIEASRGAFICFLDDDDVWLPGKLRLQIPVLERRREAGAVYSQVFHTGIGKPWPPSSRAVSGSIFNALLTGDFYLLVHSVLIRSEALKKTGYFDESLSTGEDWDLWLRLSFHFPFIFAPGLVGVYLVSPRGLHTRAGNKLHTRAENKENTERVLTKAMQMLPDSPRSADLKHTAHARRALEYIGTWADILAALREYPFILSDGWARHFVSRWMYRKAFKSQTPLSTLRELCAQMMEATGFDRRLWGRWRVRQTVAKSWAHAATHAVALAPSLLFAERRRQSSPEVHSGTVSSRHIVREPHDREMTNVRARPLVSVIIPTHNRAALLQRALDSVFSQWGLGVEFDLDVIVIDDGSADSTASIVGEYAQVRLLRLPTHRGPSAARNAGIEASRGAFICFLDDDDIWLPGRLKLQIPVLEAQPEAGAVYSQVFHTLTGKPFPASSRAVSGSIFNTLLSGNCMCSHSVLIRSEALKKTGYFDESLSIGEDWDLWLRLSFHFPFIFAPGLVGLYLVSPRGLWLSDKRAKENKERVLAKAMQMLPDSPRSAELKRTVRAQLALDYGTTWDDVLAALRIYPFMMRYHWGRHCVSRWMYKSTLKSETPLSTLWELCAQMTEATASDRRLGTRWRVLQAVAKSWAYASTHAVALAVSLLFAKHRH